ncbi:recombinase family protein [Bremerella sp. JC817]|uniref:recombinase family protein n=1 Tax=Bremerella sp. JC817 TaxID=3231756 RepID=UPI003457C69B
MRLRTPLEAPNGRILKVGEYARYSTEEQNPRSIPDQFAYSEKVLSENNAPDYEKTQLSDAELSGELVSRPGIDRLRRGIARREWDLIIVEDSSRLYRHETECMVLVEEAVDEGIRVICINDFVDTAEPDWRERLHDAARHHAQTNKYTSHRIKRTHEALWNLQAGLGKCRQGYSRRASYPATDREPERGPFFDSVNPTEAAMIKTAYEMVAAGDDLALVADWLSKQGLRKCSGAKYSDYSVKNVIDLIRRTIHRAFDTYRNKVSEKKLRTGKSRQRHRPEKVLTREMPHLRVVSDSLWYAANRMIDSRRRKTNVPSGDDHPLANIPRDSRFPLTKLFVCDICGNKMWSDGRNEGGYRCGGVRSECCWNKATALRDCVHKKISEVVVRELLSLDSTLDILVERINSVLRSERDYERQSLKLRNQVQKLTEECERLGEAVAKGKRDDPLETLLNLLVKKEQ